MNLEFAEKIQNQQRLKSFKDNISEFAEELKNNVNLINELNDDELQILYEHRNPYVKKLPLSSENDNVYNCMSFTTLQRDYESKLHLTGLVGFLFRRLKEYEIDEKDLKKEINNKDFMEKVDVYDEAKKELYYKEQYTIFKYKFLKDNYEFKVEDETVLTDKNSDLYAEYKTSIDSYDLSLEEEGLVTESINKFINKEYFKPKYVLNRGARSDYIDKLMSEQTADEKVVIERFLSSIFKFNPDKHVRQSYKYEPNENKYDNYKENVISKVDVHVKEDIESIRKYIPSDDVFYFYNSYFDSHYEVLRNCVDNIYNLSPILDLAFNIYAQFKTVEECIEFIEKYQPIVKTEINVVQNNSWRLVANGHAENKKVTQIYDKQDVFLKNMLEKHDSDTKIGKEILDNRVKLKKIKNVKRMGRHTEGLDEYKSSSLSGESVGRMGFDSVDELGDIGETADDIEERYVSEFGAELDEDGVPLDSIHCDVFHSNPNEQTFTTTKLFSKAQKLENMDDVFSEEKIGNYRKNLPKSE